MPSIAKSISVNLRAHLHQTSVSTLQQLCDDASDSVLIENNGVTAEWGCNSFSSDSIVFNENRIVQPHGRVVTALLLMLSVNGPFRG